MILTYPTLYKPAGTGSYRLAASQLFGYGGNLQNPNKNDIDIYEAPIGWSIGQCDQAGAEALCVAYLAEPGLYRELFIHGHKPHTYLAFIIFAKTSAWPLERSYDYYCQCPIAELAAAPAWGAIADAIKKSPFEYDLGKRTVHGWSYRMGAKTFVTNILKETGGEINLTKDQGETFLAVPSRLFPEVVAWQQESVDRARLTGSLTNMLGHPKCFYRNFTDSYEREIISWQPQSTVGCITHRALLTVRETLPQTHIVSNKHDSGAVLFRDGLTEKVKEEMSAAMNVPLVGRDGVRFNMRSEFQVGKNWGKHDVKKNPKGMKELK